MNRTCSRCTRSNPPEAQFCYFDGFPLLANGLHTGPIDVGALQFPTPYVFPSGRASHSFDQLALACQSEGVAAIEALQNGALARFLGCLGRTDLARVAKEAARNPSRARGLDTLLGALPTSVLNPPRLQVTPDQFTLGALRPGQDRTIELRLVNAGMRLLHGTVRCEEGDWLVLDEATGARQKEIQFAQQIVLPVHIRGKCLAARPDPLQARVVIESNGGNVSVPVRIDVPIRPFPAGALAGSLSPRQLAQQAQAHPREAAAFFESGAVARWYGANGWRYPVQGPSSSGLAAVQQFFEALGLARPPRVQLSRQEVRLQGNPGDAVQDNLELTTAENRTVFALASSNQDWLQVECPVPKGRSAQVCLGVREVPNQPGQTLQANVTVRSNGGQCFVVPVSLVIAAA